ncbi:hypothetical protein [Streptomyces sp. HSG2]|uniref:hypothetical protein n=1 Tax=Streptomyces sp. HSG2 TaxID=2797167 RepID=UPI001907929D|nr:hypothetical protein [Streptomyces sp. HSG2]
MNSTRHGFPGGVRSELCEDDPGTRRLRPPPVALLHVTAVVGGVGLATVAAAGAIAVHAVANGA